MITREFWVITLGIWFIWVWVFAIAPRILIPWIIRDTKRKIIINITAFNKSVGQMRRAVEKLHDLMEYSMRKAMVDAVEKTYDNRDMEG